MPKTDVMAIVVGYDWPANNGGYRIAVQSALKQYLRIYDRVHFVGLVDRPCGENVLWQNARITKAHIPVIRQALWLRFIRSLLMPFPAITMQFMRAQIQNQLLQQIRKHAAQKERVLLIFEDLHTTCFLPVIKREFPTYPIAIHSHNVTTKAFKSFCYKGNLFKRLAWRLEVARIQRFEKRVCEMADRVWAISADDVKVYREQLNIYCDGVVGVSLDVGRYSHVANGDPFTVLYIGSTDLRKSGGIKRFIDESWEQVRSVYPKARFLLAGRGTERFTRPDLGVIGLGFCEDERVFLGKGLIFVNPQEDGSGVKLKSIVAMLAGKALVTTPVGIEGISGEKGKHFCVGNDAGELGVLIIKLMQDIKTAKEIGERARIYAASVYIDDNLTTEVQPLLVDFASLALSKNE